MDGYSRISMECVYMFRLNTSRNIEVAWKSQDESRESDFK